MKVLKMIGTGLLVLLLIAIVLMAYRLSTEGKKSKYMSPNLGLTNGQLVACPESPNCISSYEVDEGHSVNAIEGNADTLVELAKHIDSFEQTKIIEQSTDYVYATYQSKVFGFVDDLELYFDGEAIQVRSASRVGYSDLGANLKRVESLRSFVAGR